MIFYIFLIAVLNLGLGFAAAMHLRRCYNQQAASGDPSGPDVVESNKPPTDDNDEFAADLDTLFD